MRPQYPDDTHRPTGMASAMTYLSSMVSLDTVSCSVYIVTLMYAARQCVALIGWVIGSPRVALRHGGGGTGHSSHQKIN